MKTTDLPLRQINSTVLVLCMLAPAMTSQNLYHKKGLSGPEVPPHVQLILCATSLTSASSTEFNLYMTQDFRSHRASQGLTGASVFNTVALQQ